MAFPLHGEKVITVRLVFLGPPGAGKGTQAARIADAYGLCQASTGDIFRQAIAQGDELGRTVKEYLDGGKLVPDELTSRVVEEMIVGTVDSYVLDGYPRTLGQARDLARMLGDRGQTLDCVLYFNLDDEAAVERLTGRLVCSACGANYHKEFMPPKVEGKCDACGGELRVRSDSAEEVVRRRLIEYHEKTKPLVAFYETQGLLKRGDAAPAPDAVTTATEAVLDQCAAG